MGTATPIAVGPMAAADPVRPVAGEESAADTVGDLEARGYTMAINGSITAPLERWTVNGIHNSARSGAKQDQSTTVSVDIWCPQNHDSGFGFGVGF